MKVLIAIDSSIYSAQVLEAIAARGWPSDCMFRIISVVEPCAQYEAEEIFVHQSQVILQERVDELQRRTGRQSIQAEILVGDAAGAILRLAEEWQANLIVIGSHGDTGPRKARIGSVAAAVVNQAPCNVELVKIHKVGAAQGRLLSSAFSKTQ